MPFVYRLQKVLEFRIRKKEEQLLVVQLAQQEVSIANENINRNNQEIELTKQNQRTADFSMLEAYDKYLHHLWEKDEQLQMIRIEAERKLQEEVQRLVEMEQAVKVLEKHKDKMKEAYIAEEKSAEIKQFSELGVQRYFQHSKEVQEEEEQLQMLKQLEDEYNNERSNKQ